MNGNRSSIVILGSINMDMVVLTGAVPKSGESVFGKSISQRLGGKGANQAVAAARLGEPPAMFGSIGEDMYGSQIVELLQQEGVSTTHVQRQSDVSTGLAIIILEETGDNRIISVPGANMQYDREQLANLKIALMESSLLLIQLEMELSVISQAIDLAEEAGVPVILNPGPVRGIPDDMISKVAYLTPNETEAEHLSGLPITNLEEAERAAQKLLDKGAKHVIVTLGSRGCLVAVPGRCHRIPAFPVTPVDTVAAGDAFNGALAVELAKGAPLLEAVRFATAAAALAVTREGSASSIPYRTEVLEFLNHQQ